MVISSPVPLLSTPLSPQSKRRVSPIHEHQPQQQQQPPPRQQQQRHTPNSSSGSSNHPSRRDRVADGGFTAPFSASSTANSRASATSSSSTSVASRSSASSRLDSLRMSLSNSALDEDPPPPGDRGRSPFADVANLRTPTNQSIKAGLHWPPASASAKVSHGDENSTPRYIGAHLRSPYFPGRTK